MRTVALAFALIVAAGIAHAQNLAVHKETAPTTEELTAVQKVRDKSGNKVTSELPFVYPAETAPVPAF